MLCKNRECGKEFAPESHRDKYHTTWCKNREQYLRKLDKKGKKPSKAAYKKREEVVVIQPKIDRTKNDKMSAKWLQDAWDRRTA